MKYEFLVKFFYDDVKVNIISNNLNLTNVELDKIKMYPNPTSDRLFINTNLNDYKINIYNTLGKRVKNLVSNKYTVGNHSVSWDSRNDQGNLVSAGMYIYTIQAGEFKQTRKIVLLK